MLIVAERINSSRKSIYKAISEKDETFLQKEAIAQTEAGADYIDVNSGLFAEKEADTLCWLAGVVQKVTSLPLCVDSPNPEAIKKVLPLLDKTPMINSITLEKKSFDAMLPILVDNRPCKVIALCQSDDMAAHSAVEKMELAGKLIEKLTGAGILLEDIFIDPLVHPLATDSGSAMSTLTAIASIMKAHPGVHTICGLTNASYGLPERKLINRSFLVAALSMGLDSAIIDPTDRRLMASAKTGMLIGNQDPYSLGYIKAFRQGMLAEDAK